MELTPGGHLAVESPAPGLHVVRFARPDLRPQLDYGAGVDQCELFRELHDHVLADFGEGETLVFNLALVEPFPSVFLNFFLKVRELVRARGGRLVLCRLSPEHEEIFAITQLGGLFEIVPTESQAVHEAGFWPGPEGLRLPRS
jgi:anti-anti-sigma factor